MRLYCLAYDAKDYKDAYWNGNNIKDAIKKALEAAGAKNIASPVASTLVFGGEDHDINKWNKIIVDTFGDKIFYFLCLVAGVEENENISHFYHYQPDIGLERSFKKRL